MAVFHKTMYRFNVVSKTKQNKIIQSQCNPYKNSSSFFWKGNVTYIYSFQETSKTSRNNFKETSTKLVDSVSSNLIKPQLSNTMVLSRTEI